MVRETVRVNTTKTPMLTLNPTRPLNRTVENNRCVEQQWKENDSRGGATDPRASNLQVSLYHYICLRYHMSLNNLVSGKRTGIQSYTCSHLTIMHHFIMFTCH